jgi:tetratricopeptide (TPR) repeat protein
MLKKVSAGPLPCGRGSVLSRARKQVVFGVSLLLFLGAFLAECQECPVVVGRARLAYESKKFDTAVAEFRSAVDACGEQPPVLIGLAQSYLMAQKVEDAARILDRVLEIDGRNVTALKLRGDIFYLLGKDEEAETALLRAIQIDHANEPARYALGRIYYQLQRYPEAVAQFEEIVARDPKNYRAHDNLALAYDSMNSDDLALKHYFAALELVYKDHPEYDWVYGNLADHYLRLGDYAKAFQLGAEAAKRNPASARNFFLTGKALWNLGKVEQSVRWLKQAETLDPAYPEPRYVLGQIYRKQGDVEASKRELEVFRQLNSNPRPRR